MTPAMTRWSYKKRRQGIVPDQMMKLPRANHGRPDMYVALDDVE